MVQVLDYSAGFPGAKAIKAAGYAGAVRYIGFPDRTKCTNAAELADFTAHNLGMALVYEDHADDWRSGEAGGAAAARRARAHADAIGFPRNRPIYMAVDRDVVTEAEFKAAMAYLRGAASVLGAEWVGVYGEHDVCARAAAEGAARWFWQCRAWSGVPNARLFAGRHLYQHAGLVTVGRIGSDFNDVLQDDWGQHTGGGTLSWNAKFADPDSGQEYEAWAWLVWANKKAEWALGAVQSLLTTPIPSPLPQDVDPDTGEPRTYRLVDWIVHANLKADRAAAASEAAVTKLGGMVPGNVEVSKDVVEQALADFFTRAIPKPPEMPLPAASE